MPKIIVVKIGSSIIAPKGKLEPPLIENLISDILGVEAGGFKVVLVSSGAIASGLNRLGFKKRPMDTLLLMALASLGQPILMDAYNEKFKKYGRVCAQILLTWDDFDSRKRFLNVRSTIDRLLKLNVTPIINENDAVSFEEIKFGDNDRLSALVANLIGAQMLVILSNTKGLLDGKKNLIREVCVIDSRISSLAKKEDTMFTSGGMTTKLEAAKIATASGIKTVIADGTVGSVLVEIIRGKPIGTTFLPSKEIGKAKKRWIAFGKKIRGKIYIDDGAKEALMHKGKSLLAVGLVKVEGDFKCKDAVEVRDREARLLGRGLTNFSSWELADFKTRRFEKEVIHRDNFVKVIC